MHWVVEKSSAHLTAANITSDAGGLMLREVEQRTGILKKFAACFTDYRNPEVDRASRSEDFVAQRSLWLVFGI